MTRGAEGSPPGRERLLAHLAGSPFVRIEQRHAQATLYFGTTDRPIGTVDLRTGTLTVEIGREFVGPLLERHQQLQLTARGVRLHAHGAGLAAAEALVRWRVDLEVFAPQLRAASP